MKRFIMIVLFATLLSINISYASETSGTVNTTAESTSTAAADSTSTTAAGTALSLDANTEYTIPQLQEIAVSNSRQVLVDDVDIKKKELSVRTVRSDTTAMSDSIQSIVKPQDVKLELEAAKKTKQDDLNQLKVDVYKAVLDIQLSNQEIVREEQKLIISAEKLEMAKSRFKAATITQDELDTAQYDVDSSKVSLTGAKEKLNSLYLDLNKLLNQPLEITPVKIKGGIEQAAFEDIDVDFTLNSLYNTETSVYKAAGKLDIAQTAMNIASQLYKKGDLTYDNSALDLENAKLNLASAKITLDVKVKNKFNDMLNTLDNIELAGQYAELTQKKLDNAQIKYNSGAIGRETFLSTKAACLEAEYSKLSAIVDFNKVKTEFDNMIGRK